MRKNITLASEMAMRKRRAIRRPSGAAGRGCGFPARAGNPHPLPAAPEGRLMARRFLIAISLANVMFFRIWRELLNGKQAYYTKSEPWANFAGVMISVLIL